MLHCFYYWARSQYICHCRYVNGIIFLKLALQISLKLVDQTAYKIVQHTNTIQAKLQNNEVSSVEVVLSMTGVQYTLYIQHTCFLLSTSEKDYDESSIILIHNTITAAMVSFHALGVFITETGFSGTISQK